MQAHHQVQESLNAVQSWCTQWLMQLNVSKCSVLYFGPNNPKLTYRLQDNALAHSSTVRDLGMTVADSGSVSPHCIHVAAKARRLTGDGTDATYIHHSLHGDAKYLCQCTKVLFDLYLSTLLQFGIHT